MADKIVHAHFSLPLKAAVFTCGQLSLPTLSWLYESNQLAGVLLGEWRQPHDPQFINRLNDLHVPYCVFHPENPDKVHEQLERWHANIGLILGFSRILPENLLNIFKYGIYNLHASELPKYRGAMPLYWQIRNGEKRTALTVHRVTHIIDSGEIIIQVPIDIDPRDTLYSLASKVAEYAPAVVHKLFDSVNQTKNIPTGRLQQGSPSRAPWPTQEQICLNWSDKTAAQIADMARAGNAAFGTTLFISHKAVSLLQATPVEFATYGTPPGTLVHIGEPEGLIAATHDSAVRLDILSTADGVFSGIAFAERFRLDAGMLFESPAVLPTAANA